ncbi:MAG: phosphoenolpyruvate carboxylase [Methanobacteriota archaeon]|nr:MAG: phosphoenolpyruvate carboxylase [Euryarchaeota archaeon]
MEQDYLPEKKEIDEIFNFINEILEEVIIEQGGREIFQIEEGLRLLAHHYLQTQDWKSLSDIEKELIQLPPETLGTIIKSMILSFELANLVESRYRKGQYLNDELNSQLNLQHTIQYARQKGINVISFIELMHKSLLQLIFSPHEFNKRKQSFLKLLNSIFSLLGDIHRIKGNQIERYRLRARIKSEVTILWGTNEGRLIQSSEIEKVRNSMYYFDNSIVEAIARVYQELYDGTMLILEKSMGDYNLPIFLEFSYLLESSSPNGLIEPRMPLMVLFLQKRLMLRKYIAEVKTLLKKLPISSKFFEPSKELIQSLQEDELLFPDFAALTREMNIDEPFRRKLDFIRLKLENTLTNNRVRMEPLTDDLGLVGYNPYIISLPSGPHYQRSQELFDDLKVIYSSLKRSGGKMIAQTHFHPLMEKVRLFGFHLAPQELVINAKHFHNFLDEVFRLNGISGYLDLNYDDKAKLIEGELNKIRPLGAHLFYETNLLSDSNERLVELFQNLVFAVEVISPNAIQSIIIEDYQSYTDYLAVLLTCKEVGLLKVSPSKVDRIMVDLVPMVGDENTAIRLLHDFTVLLQNSVYRQVLQKRKRTQALFLNFSVLAKQVGYLRSQFLLHTLQEKLTDFAAKRRIRFRFAHGRGSPVGRGGLPSNLAIEALPHTTSIDLQILEVGEAIPSKYSDVEMALFNIKSVVTASLKKRIGHRFGKRKGLTTEYMKHLDKISDMASQHYREFVGSSKFIRYLLECSPLDSIDFLLSNNPYFSVDKLKEGMGIEAINPTSWNYAWNLSRLNISMFFGVGSALEQFQKTHGLDILRRMHSEWGYFRVLLDNLQMVLLKNNLAIANYFASNGSNESKEIFAEMRKEFERTVQMLLKITGNKELLEGSYLRVAVLDRLRFLDPLSLMFPGLWKRWRMEKRRKGEHLKQLLLGIEESVNVITTGLRNIG